MDVIKTAEEMNAFVVLKLQDDVTLKNTVVMCAMRTANILDSLKNLYVQIRQQLLPNEKTQLRQVQADLQDLQTFTQIVKNEPDYDMSFQYLDEARGMLENLARKMEVLLESQIELSEDFRTIKVIRLVKPQKPDIISVIKQIIQMREQMQIETNKFTVKQLALKLMKLKKITEEQLTTYFQALEQYYIAKA